MPLIPLFQSPATSEPVVYAGIDMAVFPTTIGEGAQGGPRFNTSILTMFSGSEQRCQNWLDPLLSWNVSSGVKSKQDFAILLAFFRAQGGRSRAFLFTDPLDSQAYRQPIGTGTGSQTQFQLARYYVTDRVSARPITRPVPGTVVVYVNGSAAGGWSVDPTTGIVTFVSAPASGAAITADFAFYVPVRFDTDAMAGTMEGGRVTGWDSIPIVEVRERWAVPMAAPPVALSEQAAIFPDMVSRQMGGPRYGTQIATSVSGWEERAPQWGSGRLRWDIEEATLSWMDAQNLLYWFRTHAGRAKTFSMRDWTDYQVISEPMVQYQGDPHQWQIVKRYSDGPMTILRNISQVDPTAMLTIVDVSGNALTGYGVDMNGVVTFPAPQSTRPVVTCQFLVPVRFDTDTLSMRHVDGRQWTVDSLSVVEVAPVPAGQESS